MKTYFGGVILHKNSDLFLFYIKVTFEITMETRKEEELTYPTLVTNKKLLTLILSIQTRLTKGLWEIL